MQDLDINKIRNIVAQAKTALRKMDEGETYATHYVRSFC